MLDYQQDAFNHATPGLGVGLKLGDYLSIAALALVSSVLFTVGTEASNAITVTGQLVDANGKALPVQKRVTWWLSDTAGAAPTGTGPATSTVVSTGTALAVLTAKITGVALTNTLGIFALTLTETGTPTFYLNVEVEGVIASSPAITFA